MPLPDSNPNPDPNLDTERFAHAVHSTPSREAYHEWMLFMDGALLDLYAVDNTYLHASLGREIAIRTRQKDLLLSYKADKEEMHRRREKLDREKIRCRAAAAVESTDAATGGEAVGKSGETGKSAENVQNRSLDGTLENGETLSEFRDRVTAMEDDLMADLKDLDDKKLKSGLSIAAALIKEKADRLNSAFVDTMAQLIVSHRIIDETLKYCGVTFSAADDDDNQD